MAYGAGYVAAKAAGAAAIVDPRKSAAPATAEVYRRYPHIGPVLPAVGYSATELAALAATINASDADIVVAATPIDLARLIHSDKPIIRARYEFAEAGTPSLASVIDEFLEQL
jgi:predicted GTPase